MQKRVLAVFGAVAGGVTAVVVTTLLVHFIDRRWPDDMSRMAGYPRSLLWAGLLAVAHLVGGLCGGGVTAALAWSRPTKRAVWVALSVFLLLSVPALGAFDRPFEMGSMIALNVITALAIVAGAAIMWTLLLRRRTVDRLHRVRL